VAILVEACPRRTDMRSLFVLTKGSFVNLRMTSMRILTAVVLTASIWPAAAQTIQVVGDNVGIGTGSPGAKLDVAGNLRSAPLAGSGTRIVGADSTGVLVIRSSGAGSGLDADLLDGFNSGLGGADTILRTASNGYLLLDNWIRGSGIYNPNGDHAYFDGNYFQTRTSYGLRVAQRDSTARGYIYFDGSDSFGLLHKDGGWAVRTTPASTYVHNTLYAPIYYDSNNANYVVDPDGMSRLHEVRVSAMDGTHVSYDSGYYGDRPYQWGYQEGGAWSYPYPDLVFGYHTGMKFGANTGYGGMKFYADHPSFSNTLLFSIGAGDSHVRVANNLYVGSQVQAASFRSTSSRRWKDNIQPMQDALATVRRLQGVTYRWKHDTNPEAPDDVGFIAEEVDLVVPQVVGRDAEGLPDSVDYGRLTALLVEAVKETDQRQAAMSSELESLRAELAAFREQRREPAQSQTHQGFLIAAGLAIAFTLGRKAKSKK
jgi:uncharacterized small protein (DUF1192 family)